VTDATESLFVFSADRPNSRKHSLYIAAIDNEGKVDATPAATNFLAVDYGIPQVQVWISSNLNPTPHVAPALGDTLPAFNTINPADPVLVRFNWDGQDPDGTIQAWRYRVDSGTEVTVGPDVLSAEFRYDPADRAGSDVWLGFHEFRLVAIDDAGAKGTESLARFIINFDPDTHIDEVWTFRANNTGSVPDRRIYPGEPGDTARFAYHFGRLAFKFHGSDIDGPEPIAFRWNIKGTLIQSGTDPNNPWVGKQCGNMYCDTTGAGTPYLDTDNALSLYIRSRDNHEKVDGTADTIMFWVDYPPTIGSISHTVAPPETVTFNWECEDPDEDTSGPINPGVGDRALIRYSYSIDGGNFVTVDERFQGKIVKRVVVTGLSEGHHTFTLKAYNAEYQSTRSDTKEYVFDLQY
jgi:hypothetical protein